VTAVPRWFGPGEPLLGWVSAPAAEWTGTGVLIVPPVGYEYWSSHRTLRVIAEGLAASGHLALRYDHHGTGDSSGDQWDPGRVVAWREGVRHAVAELRAMGAERVVIAGVRLGATLALLEGAEAGADLVVAWKPLVSGKRFSREVRLLSTTVPGEAAPTEAVAAGGTVFTEETLTDLAAISLTALQDPPAARTLLLAPEAEGAKLAGHLRSLGCEVDHLPDEGGEAALETPAEYATVPEAIVAAVVSAVSAASGPRPLPAAGPASGDLEWRGEQITEEVVALGPHGLVGVLTSPRSGGSEGPTAVFLNSGSEPHIGPGRAWVEYARGLAATGRRSLRVDFRGWGESPDEGFAPGRPYDAHCLDDTAAIVAALRALGHHEIVLVGLCAGAWVALQEVLRTPVEGIVALNAQLYWRPGDPVEATMAETHARRAPDREREQRGCSWGVWSALDVLGHRPWAGAWLDDVVRAGTPVDLVFAAGDDGIAYLRTRLGRRLERALSSGRIRVVELPEIDHSMHRVWLRAAVQDAIEDHLRLVGRAYGGANSRKRPRSRKPTEA
jgi:pimeloyl-ACP methyl ester carboxylesterase